MVYIQFFIRFYLYLFLDVGRLPFILLKGFLY
ncbi:hypothetical protein BB2000_2199 [Proteus mirabilis BB2000]|nr:hypothetical protein BB2000_2199 [Proteus mirabilis BB2000]